MLLGVDKAVLLRNLSHLGLVQRTQRQTDMRQLLLRKIIQHITLILALVQALFQQPAAGGCVLFHPGVTTYSMPCSSAQSSRWRNFIYLLQSMQGLGVPPVS